MTLASGLREEEDSSATAALLPCVVCVVLTRGVRYPHLERQDMWRSDRPDAAGAISAPAASSRMVLARRGPQFCFSTIGAQPCADRVRRCPEGFTPHANAL